MVSVEPQENEPCNVDGSKEISINGCHPFESFLEIENKELD